MVCCCSLGTVECFIIFCIHRESHIQYKNHSHELCGCRTALQGAEQEEYPYTELMAFPHFSALHTMPQQWPQL